MSASHARFAAGQIGAITTLISRCPVHRIAEQPGLPADGGGRSISLQIWISWLECYMAVGITPTALPAPVPGDSCHRYGRNAAHALPGGAGCGAEFLQGFGNAKRRLGSVNATLTSRCEDLGSSPGWR